MYCANCGSELVSGAKFCQSCGFKVRASTDPSRQQFQEGSPDKTHGSPSGQIKESGSDIQKESVRIPAPSANDDLVGVKGWLLFFAVMLVIVHPIFGGALTIGSFLNTSEYFEYVPGLATGAWVDFAASISITIFGMYAGLLIWSRDPNGVVVAKRYLLTLLAYSYASIPIFLMLVDVPDQAFSDFVGSMFGSVFWGTVWFAIWYIYLVRSERVKQTFSKISNEAGSAKVGGDVKNTTSVGEGVSSTTSVGGAVSNTRSAPDISDQDQGKAASPQPDTHGNDSVESTQWGSINHFIVFLESGPAEDSACAYIKALISSGYDPVDLDEAIMSRLNSDLKYIYRPLVWDCL